MAKHLNPLEKEFLIRKFKGNSKVKLGDFCRANNVSETSFKKWLKQYEEAGIEGLARADAEIGNILQEGHEKSDGKGRTNHRTDGSQSDRRRESVAFPV